MKTGFFFQIPEGPDDVDILRVRAVTLTTATCPSWLDARDSDHYRYLGSKSMAGLDQRQTGAFLAEIRQLEVAGLVADQPESDPLVRHLYIQSADDYDRWSIGIYTGVSPLSLQPSPSTDNPVLSRGDVTDVPAVLVADPFIIRDSGCWHMFFEVLNWRSNKGEIGLATSTDGLSWKYEQIVLVEPFHLSYPCVFSHAGEYFMVPEARQSETVRLYRSTSFPTDWVLDGFLLEGEGLVDATPFHHDNHWWMFAGANDPADTLRLYMSATLTGTWREHPASPLIERNMHLTRPAGRVVADGSRTLRFAQNCSPQYGLDVRVFKIDELLESSYRESPVLTKPILAGSGKGWNACGMHHLDAHQLPDDSWIACVDGWTRSATT